MADFSKSMAPPGRTANYGGLNGCYPVAVGYDHHLNKNQQALIILATGQGNVCPIDGQDMTVPSVGNRKMGANPSKGKVDWLNDEVICAGCQHWMIENEKTNLPKALEAGSLERLTEMRLASIGSKKPKTQEYEKNADVSCLFCERDYVQRSDTTTREVAQKTCDQTPRGLAERMKAWPCMQGLQCVCVKCFNQFAGVIYCKKRESLPKEMITKSIYTYL